MIRRFGPLLVLLVFAIIPAITSNAYYLGIVITIMTNIILAVTLWPLIRTGLLSMSHAAFMAIGAYGCALLVMKLGLNFWLALPLGGVMSGLVAAIIGFPILRVRGIYFMIITFGLNEVVELVFFNWRGMTGGPDGLTRIPAPNAIPFPGLGTIEFIGKTPYYYLLLVLVVITVVFVYRLWGSRFGRACRAVEESGDLAQSLGINLLRYKLTLFSISAVFAGIVGGFHAHYLKFLAPSDFGIWTSIFPFVYIMVGGVGSIVGPITGTIILAGATAALGFLYMLRPIIFGALLIVTMLFVPAGFIGFPRRVSQLFSKG